MVKFSAFSLMILSFTPFHSIILKNPRRFSRNIPFNHSTKSRVTSYAQNVQLHTEDMMGASRYLPPLFSVASMMEWTDNHYRTLARLISKHAWLYTEMLAAETIVYQQGNLAFVSVVANLALGNLKSKALR
ncbi:uncharacterized protein LOC105804227 isoform X2 [Gossypium raimondii]|uniref:uncharacterized protein LOC105804227 isoform X2 n=1 Tax=Gossypium raimondii TaxID=29730 RepID=UPI00227C708B|nr:uncharacterized protein LOC105804227 isoform X2 [Gossypium raimondii]